MAEPKAQFAFRAMGAFRGNTNTTLQQVIHEMNHSAKERSAFRVNDYVDISDAEYALNNPYVYLVYTEKQILRQYTGDVWTVRVKNDPYRVYRTRARGRFINYDECIVRGKAYGIFVASTKCDKDLLAFAKRNHIKYFDMNNIEILIGDKFYSLQSQINKKF